MKNQMKNNGIDGIDDIDGICDIRSNTYLPHEPLHDELWATVGKCTDRSL